MEELSSAVLVLGFNVFSSSQTGNPHESKSQTHTTHTLEPRLAGWSHAGSDIFQHTWRRTSARQKRWQQGPETAEWITGTRRGLGVSPQLHTFWVKRAQRKRFGAGEGGTGRWLDDPSQQTSHISSSGKWGFLLVQAGYTCFVVFEGPILCNIYVTVFVLLHFSQSVC